MRKLLRLAGLAAMGAVLLTGCQKKAETTTETEKTTEGSAYPATPGTTPPTTHTETTTTTSTSSPAPTPNP